MVGMGEVTFILSCLASVCSGDGKHTLPLNWDEMKGITCKKQKVS
jgi:hypothetical protein